MHPTMPPSEALYRNFRNAHAVLLNTGLSHREADQALRESFAAFYARLCLETADPRGMALALGDAVARHLDNHGLSCAWRLPRLGMLSRLLRRAAA